MAGGFNITAQIVLRGPANINQVVSQIQRQLGSINANVNVQMPTGTANQFSSLINQAGALNTGLNNLNNSSKNLTKVGASATRAAAPLKEAKTAAFQFGESIGEAARKFTAFSIAAGAMVAVISSIRQGVGAAIDFQHELVRLEQIGGNVNGAIGAISGEITRLSTTLGTSSKELIGVASTLRQAGLSAKDTQTALRGVAEAGLSPSFTEIKNTVEAAIVAMQTFGLEAKDLYGVLGSINRVAADFAVESDDLTQALRKSGGAFKAAGGSLNELIALFTSVRSTTRESAEAISSGFNTIFARLQRPEAIEQLRLMGVNLRYASDEAKIFGATEGEFVGPYEAVRRLNTALSSVPPASQEYAAIVELIGGFRQVSRVIPLIQQFGTSEKALQSAMAGTNSLTQSTIIAQKSLSNQLAITGEKFLEVFRVIGENKQLQQFAGLVLSLANGLAGVAKAAAPLVPLLGALALAKVGQSLAFPFNPQFSQGLKSGLTTTKKFAIGGVVPGVGNSDSVRADLTPGEFVIRKSSAKAIGYDRLHQMNRYARGGPVLRFANAGEVPKKRRSYVFDFDDVLAQMNKSDVRKMESLKADKQFRAAFAHGYGNPDTIARSMPTVLTKLAARRSQQGHDVHILTARGAGENDSVKNAIFEFAKSQGINVASVITVADRKDKVLDPTGKIRKASGVQKKGLALSELSANYPGGIKFYDDAIGNIDEAKNVSGVSARQVRGSRTGNTSKIKKSSHPLGGDTVVIKAPRGAVAMLVTDRSAKEQRDTLTLPIQSLKGESKSAYEKELSKLTGSGSLSRREAEAIRAITVPILVQPVNEEISKETKSLLKKNVLSSLYSTAQKLDKPSAGLKLSPTDVQETLDVAIGSDGLGRFFEGALQVIARRLGSKGLGKTGAVFDFAPVDTEGFTRLFGPKVAGLYGDAKLTDNAYSRASMVSKALRQFGFTSGKSSIQRHGLDEDYIDPETGKPIVYQGTKFHGQTLSKLDEIKRRALAGEKFATGGRVSADPIKKFAAGGAPVGTDTVSALLTPGEFVIRREAAQRIGYNRLHQMNRYADGGYVQPKRFEGGGFAERAKQFFGITFNKGKKDILAKEAEDFLEGKPSPFNQAEITKRQKKLAAFQPGQEDEKRLVDVKDKEGKVVKDKEGNKVQKEVTVRVLRIPFGRDKLAMIGKGLVGEAGENILGGNVSNLVKDLSPKPKALLDKLGIKEVDAKLTKHIISNEATADFTNTIHNPVSQAIAGVFKRKFSDASGDYTFSKAELSGLEGILLQKYIQGVTKTRLTGTGANALFDFPEGLSKSDNFNKIILPSPVAPRALTDAKLNVATPTTQYSMIAKYLNLRYGMLTDLIAGKRPSQNVRGVEKAGIKRSFNDQASPDTLLLNKARLALESTRTRYRAIKDDPSKQEEYNKLLDRSIGLVRLLDDLQKKEQTRVVGEYLGKKRASTPFAVGGKVRAPARFAGGGRSMGTDTVPALLTPGEFVINRDSAQRIGYNALSRMNRYAQGGVVRPQRFAVGGRVFEYEGLDPQGARIHRGKQKATSLQAAKELLENYGYTITNIRELIQHGPQPRSIAGADLSGGDMPTPRRSQKTFSNFRAEPGGAPGGRFYGNAPTNAAQNVGQPQFPESMSPSGIKYKSISSGKFPENIQNPKPYVDPVVAVLKDILIAVKDKTVKVERTPGSKTVKSSSPEEVTNIDTPTGGRLARLKEKLSGNVGKFGTIAAVAASQYLPQLAESAFGSPTKPTDLGRKQTGLGFSVSEGAQALGGGAAGAATGFAVGASVGGIPGGLLAGAIAGLYGFTSALGEASDQVKSVKLDKDLTELSEAISRATSNTDPLKSSDIASVRGGIQSILQNASTASDKNAFLAEKVNTSELANIAAKVVSVSGIVANDDSNAQLQKFLTSSNNLGSDIARLMSVIPGNRERSLSDVLKPVLEQGKRVAVERQRGLDLEKIQKSVENQTRLFDKLSQALAVASGSLALLDDRANATLTLAEGQYTPQPLRERSLATESFGTGLNIEGVNRSIDFITNPLEDLGGELGKSFNRTAKSVNTALDILPDVLQRVVRGGVNEQNFSAKAEAGVVAAGADRGLSADDPVIREFKKALLTFDLPDLLKRITTDLNGVIDDLTKRSFPNLAKAVQDGAKQLEDAQARYQAGLQKFQEGERKAFEARTKVSTIQTEAASARQSILARRTGFTSRDTLSPARLNAPIREEQVRLGGAAAFDPTALANQFRGLTAQIANLQVKQREAKGVGEANRIENQLTLLGTAASRSYQALNNLADASRENAAIQGRLNVLNAEEAQRQGLAERFFTADPADQLQMHRTANVANAVATGNLNAAALPPQMRQALIAFSHDLEDVVTPILNGLSGKEFRGAILGQALPQFNLPVEKRAERADLEGNLINNLDRAAKAQAELSGIIGDQNNTFLDKLQANQRTFLDEYRQIVLSAERRDVESKLTVAESQVSRADLGTKAADTLKGAGFKNLDSARSLLESNVDFKNLVRVSEVRKQLDNDQTNLGDFKIPDLQKRRAKDPTFLGYDSRGAPISKGVPGTALTDAGRAQIKSSLQFPSFSDVDKEKVLTNVERKLSSTNNASDAQVTQIVRDSIKEVFTELRKAASTQTKESTQKITNTTGFPQEVVTGALPKVADLSEALRSLEGFKAYDDINKGLSTTNKEVETFKNRIEVLGNTLKTLNKIGGGETGTIQQKAAGGSIFAPRGTDTVPAMLTPGEFVVNARSAKANQDILKRINSSTGTQYRAGGGLIYNLRKKLLGTGEASGAYAGFNTPLATNLGLKDVLPDIASLSDKSGENNRKDLTQLEGGIERLAGDVNVHKNAVQNFSIAGSFDFERMTSELASRNKAFDDKKPFAGLDGDRANFYDETKRTAKNTERLKGITDESPEVIRDRALKEARAKLSPAELSSNVLAKLQEATPPSPINFSAKIQPQSGRPDTAGMIKAYNDRRVADRAKQDQLVAGNQARIAERKLVLPSADLGKGVLRNRFVDTNVNPRFRLPDYSRSAQRVDARRSGVPHVDIPGLEPTNLLTGQVFQADPEAQRRKLFVLRHPNATKGVPGRISTKVGQRDFNAPASSFDQRAKLIEKRKAKKRVPSLARRFGIPPIPQVRPESPNALQKAVVEQLKEAADIERRRKLKLPLRGFAHGGEATGTDVVPAMLTPGEFIVSRDAARANSALLNKINNSKGRAVYRAEGGPIGANGVRSTGGETSGVSLSADSIAQLKGFNDVFANSLGQLNQAMGGFNTGVGLLTGFASNFQSMLAPLTNMGQSFQTLVPAFTQFNAAAQTMSANAAAISVAANQFTEASRLLSAMPTTITHTIQGNNTLTVVHSVPEALKSLGDQLAKDFIQKAVDQITADLKTGKILPPQG